jgi:hypothetical protein
VCYSCNRYVVGLTGDFLVRRLADYESAALGNQSVRNVVWDEISFRFAERTELRARVSWSIYTEEEGKTNQNTTGQYTLRGTLTYV